MFGAAPEFFLVDLTAARAWAASLVALLAPAQPPGSVARVRAPDIAGLNLARLTLAEACLSLSTGHAPPMAAGPDGVQYPVIASRKAVKRATKLPRTHPGRYLLSAAEQCYQLREAATDAPYPADYPSGDELVQPYRPGPVQAPLGALPVAGYVVLGVGVVAGVAAGAWVADRYLEREASTDVTVGQLKAKADAQAKIEIAKAKLEAGQPVSLDEVDAANADAYQRRQLIKDVAPWAIGLTIAGGGALVAARKAELL